LSAAYDRLAGGYYNPGLKSSGNPGGLAGQGAVRANWDAMLADIATVISEGAMSAQQALDAAASAFEAPGSKSTSASNVLIPALGAIVTFGVIENGRTYSQGQTAVASVTGDATKAISGRILSWDPGTKELVIEAQHVTGAGTFNAWTIALTAPIDATLTGRVANLEASNDAQRSLALFIAKEFI